MKAIIVDDEEHNIENLAVLLKRSGADIKVTGVADNIVFAEKLIRETAPDIVFLDIQMGKETGFDLLQTIYPRNFEVIFVTAYDKYGIQAVKYAALDYILKPVDSEELKLAIEKARQKLLLKQNQRQLDFLVEHIRQNNKPSKIALPQQNEIRYVAIKDIIRCEANNAYTYFFLVGDQKILTSKSLKEYEELLAEHQFIRTHQSHLVNPLYIKSLLKEDGGQLLLTNGAKVPISKARKDFVKEILRNGQ
ncbi:LytR/AlgR family response regulator transcription factor [Niabella soli]|uniref:Chemotaxis protein CheY n=1 Tax=Niabella soli DSM 19437 TaxID=929713 RepID=W0F391_9BACT|nr:LytTR family DNA-binding domain-containing protein [Niabella soli]AHF16253.1 chemotaxis protein CheY [Niabella soli DSM 19437]